MSNKPNHNASDLNAAHRDGTVSASLSFVSSVDLDYEREENKLTPVESNTGVLPSAPSSDLVKRAGLEPATSGSG
jgi:hypothetical protein